jgi:RNA polymerase sigma-70 factor, ECF subfamily
MTPKKPWLPGKPLVSPSADEALAGVPGPQLSGAGGVNRGVSTFALHRGILAAADPRERAGNDPGVVAEPLEGLSDAQIMLRVKAGDDAAFDYLVSKFRRAMVSFMYRMARNPAVAEELAQEVFLRVYRSRSTYAADAKFTTWLYRIATNLAVNYSRDTRPERAGAQSLDVPDAETGLLPDVADGQPTAEQALVRRERMAAIRRRVQALPERQRLAVVMHKYQELDYREIGQILKLSESATKSLLFRAYETLREELKEFVK